MKTDANLEVRQAIAGNGQDTRTIKSNRTLKMIIICAVSLILIAAIIFAAAGLTSSSFKAKHTTALEVDNTKVSVAEYKFYFMTYVNTYLNNNYSYLVSTGFDLSKPLNEQMIDDETSWYDYFATMTNEYIRQIVVLSNLAEENGLGHTEDDESAANEYLLNMATLAEESGMSLQEYINEAYGTGTDENTIKDILIRFYTANRFSSSTTENLEITDDQLESYFEDNADKFKTADFRIMYFTPSYEDGASQNEIDSASAISKESAEKMLSEIGDEASFIALAKEYAPEDTRGNYNDDGYTLQKGITKDEMGDNDISNWIFSTDRNTGDKTMIESDGVYCVIYMVSPAARAEYNSVTFRNILVQPVSLDTEPSSEEISQAESRAESIVRIFNGSDSQSEEAFGELAKQYSEDELTSANGGLYEDVGLNQIADPVENWAFSSERKPGDMNIIQTGTSFQIVYFCRTGEPYWKIEVANAIKTDRIMDLISEETSDKEIEYNGKGMEMASSIISEII